MTWLVYGLLAFLVFGLWASYDDANHEWQKRQEMKRLAELEQAREAWKALLTKED